MKDKMMPLGIDDFSDVVSGDYYYVDKTGMIKELLNDKGLVNLFTRPRRFGKSLNMSMLQHFFEIGTDKSMFEGLDISKETELCEKYMGQYPVISISLKQVAGSSFDEAKTNLWKEVRNAARKFPVLLDSPLLDDEDKTDLKKLRSLDGSKEDGLAVLSGLLYKHYGKKVIILIDEYDAPLQKAYERGYYDEMIIVIRQLFGYALKSNESLFFSVLTGCMRISKESIFSDLNNPVIHSITDEQFDEWFGFTDSEVRELLKAYDIEEYYDITREWYDGYMFGKQSVYCPWDVINWCNQLTKTSDRLPQNFWVNSGGTDIIREFAEKADSVTRDEISQLIEGKSVRKELTFEISYKEMLEQPENIWVLLYTAGYLTHRKRNEDGSFELCIPNREVRSIFVTKVDKWFKAKVLGNKAVVDEFYSAFATGDAKGMEECLNYQMADAISFYDGGTLEYKETFYHGLLNGEPAHLKWPPAMGRPTSQPLPSARLTTIIGILNTREGWKIRSNREAGKGRADIIAINLRTKESYITEIKYVQDEDDLTAAARDAIDQINQNMYDKYFDKEEAVNIRHYGIAFCKKKCKVILEENA